MEFVKRIRNSISDVRTGKHRLLEAVISETVSVLKYRSLSTVRRNILELLQLTRHYERRFSGRYSHRNLLATS